MSEILFRVSLTSWRMWWRALPTNFSNAATSERSRRHGTRLQLMPLTRIGGNSPIKDRLSQSSDWIHSNHSRWKSTSLCWGSPLTKSSISSKPAMVKRPKSIQYTSLRSGRILFLPRYPGSPDHPLQKPPKISGRTCLLRFPQRVCSYPRVNLQCRTVKRSASYQTVTHDHPV